MATIYLVRHGQASFGKENYDQLSPRGWEQGRILGRWLAGKVEPGAVFGGNLACFSPYFFHNFIRGFST